jgi:hypothetical protein
MEITETIAGVAESRSMTVPTAPPGRQPGDPLDVLLSHLKAHPRVDAAALVVVDAGRSRVRPAATWFATELVEQAVAPGLTHAYDDSLPGLVEATLERGRALFLPRVGDWEAAPRLRARLERDGGGAERTAAVWEAYASASVIVCPVRTALGRALGVLGVGSLDPGRPFTRADSDTMEVMADLAALALERSELLEAEASRTRDEALLKRAAEDTAASLEIAEVQCQVVRHALAISGADHAFLSSVQPGSGRLVTVVHDGADLGDGELEPDPGLVAAAARTRTVQRGDETDPSLHVPIALGPRLFGVLSALRPGGRPFEQHDVDVLSRLGRSSAAAIANAIDFERERRVARSLTRGFVPDSLPELHGYDMGLVYEPAARQPAGGDLYGAWALPRGEVALLIGDVAGKGVETAALSAMTRFFVEARSWDCDSPAKVLAQANVMLRNRLPSDTFVTAFLAFLSDGIVRYANAGHLSPIVLRAAGSLGELPGRGLPLGIEERPLYEDLALELGQGDLLMGYTDGLVEARRDREMFGLDRLGRVVAEAGAAGTPPGEVVQLVFERVRAWTDNLTDDSVALALRRR